jgi:hypothetical protein
MRRLGERLRQQSAVMQGLFEKDNPEEKKIMILAQSLSKEITSQR